MGNEQASFTCPYCAQLGFSDVGLSKHLSTQHPADTNPKKEVVCPICAVLPSSNGGDPNHLTDNLLQHINIEHVSGGGKQTAGKHLDDTLNDIGNASSTSVTAAAAAAAALRFSRRLNYSQNTSRSSLTSQSGITIGNSSRGAGNSSGSINRYAFQFGQSLGGSSGGIGSTNSGANVLSSFMRSAR